MTRAIWSSSKKPDRNESHNLRTATDELVQGLGQSNPRLRQTGGNSNVIFAGRRGLATVLSNVSDVTGEQERIALYTTQLNDGSLFYVEARRSGISDLVISCTY